MKKMQFLWVILGGMLLALGFTQCGGDATGTLGLTTCDGGPEAGCPVAPDPTPGGW